MHHIYKVCAAFLAASAVLSSCVNIAGDNPYEKDLCNFTVKLVLPSGNEGTSLEAVQVTAEDVIGSNEYSSATDERGVAAFSLPKGMYRFSASRKEGSDIFNGSMERTKVTADAEFTMKMIHSILGDIVIKEIYCGGCKQFSDTGEYLGDYQSDKYIILHNNSNTVQYLDGICIGGLAPYNSSSSAPFKKVKVVSGEMYMDVYAPIIQALWQFGGSGESFPLEPGEDAVVAFCGAIDHTVLYKNSVNLNKPGYFVCYNTTYFTNERYHPAPGDQIKEDHILNCVVKLGQANAYTVSVSSPALVIFRPEGVSMESYLGGKTPFGDDAVIQLPGSSIDKILNIPWVWIIDAVEVFGDMNGNKRMHASADAGYVVLSDSYLGHTLMRKTDEDASATAGYEVLLDNNNSSVDFYESDIQSLHE